MKKTLENQIKNRIIIETRECGESKMTTLYNFQEVKVNEVAQQIRVCCDGRYYYFGTYNSHITDIEVY